MPMVAMVTVSPASTPGTKLDSPVKIDPQSAPSASKGANSPPGVPAAYESGPVKNRTAKYSSRIGSTKVLPPTIICARTSPPPLASGSRNSVRPMVAPIVAPMTVGGILSSRATASSRPRIKRL
ncbi:hypothetical protein D9M69_687870 [compost metagenome]